MFRRKFGVLTPLCHPVGGSMVHASMSGKILRPRLKELSSSKSARPSAEPGSVARQLSARVQNPLEQIGSSVDPSTPKKTEDEGKKRKVNQGIWRTSVLVGCLLDASFLPPSTTPSW
ncbi:hypothetical protein GQ607_005875 [Colletotrichum asianum]|uniref:Uncharacterized protein n=1 Tax=Colletotrichum asianum TaxID=702518 RepID=A0A8H3WJ83_9PEZI|nr:hypothetical protein GQ607_005875 [Colletotrichum asianum]